MTNGTSVLWKILSGLVKKWPEMVAKWTPVTTRLGVTVFIAFVEREIQVEIIIGL